MDCLEDQLKRARTMAYGGPQSDLSFSDQIALQGVIERLEELEQCLAEACASNPSRQRGPALGPIRAFAAA